MEINEELHKLCPGTDGGEDLAESLGMASQGAKRHVPVFGRQYHFFGVGHIGGRELPGAGSRARGAIVQTAGRRGGPVPSVLSAWLEMRDTQGHGEREEWFCTGDGTQDSGLRSVFGQPFASESETGSAEHCQENSDNGGEDALLLFKLRDGDLLLAVLLYGLDGDDRTRTTAPPSGNGGARDGQVFRQAFGTGPDDLIAETVVVRAAHP